MALVHAGVDPTVIALWMGHASPLSTRPYLHADMQLKQQAAALDTDGLDIDQDDLTLLLSVDTETWKREATLIAEHLRTFGSHLPSPLWDQYNDLLRRLG